MIEILSGILFGVAAHQTDRVVKVWPTNWEYISRYIIGYLTCGFTFTLILKKINPHGIKDGLLAFGGAGMSVGIGVVLARIYDEVCNG